jgi:hypothetical protein
VTLHFLLEDGMKHGLFLGNVVITAALFFGLAGCKEEGPVEPVKSCAPAGIVGIEVVTPAAGARLTVGTTVTIEMKVNADQIDGVVPQITINDGIDYFDIPPTKVGTSAGGGNQCLSYSWTIGQENQTVPYSETMAMCRVRVIKYSSTIYDESDLFTIVKN